MQIMLLSGIWIKYQNKSQFEIILTKQCFRWIVMQTMAGSLWASFHVVMFNMIIFMLFMAHARAVFTDPGIVPLPSHRIDFSDSHSEGGSIAPKEDWTICTK